MKDVTFVNPMGGTYCPKNRSYTYGCGNSCPYKEKINSREYCTHPKA